MLLFDNNQSSYLDLLRLSFKVHKKVSGQHNFSLKTTINLNKLFSINKLKVLNLRLSSPSLTVTRLRAL